MPSIILSDNGVISGSAGLKETAASDGALALQTTTAGGVATTALSISNTQVVTYANQPVYTGGTANGVAYLNGSKVLTTGSALVFDGTNLGLGVTPSAWAAAYKTFDFGSRGGLASEGTAVQLSLNGYYNGGWKYKQTAFASFYEQYNGTHAWYTAPSGTAGNAISFTQAMTLDASGNLGVGTTSPVAKLDVLGGNVRVALSGGSASTLRGYEIASATTVFASLKAESTTGEFRVDAGFSGFGGYTTFYTNGSERARIDSSGNLLVGTTSPLTSGKVSVQFNGTNNNGIVFNDTVPASGVNYSLFQITGTTIGSIARVGATSAVIYNTMSDYRLKTVIGPVADAGQRIDALEPVEYEWKADGSRTRGFLAHQFQEVYAGSVSGTKDAVDAEGKPVYQSMQAGTSEVIADLVAEIQSLRKRLAAAGI